MILPATANRHEIMDETAKHPKEYQFSDDSARHYRSHHRLASTTADAHRLLTRPRIESGNLIFLSPAQKKPVQEALQN